MVRIRVTEKKIKKKELSKKKKIGHITLFSFDNKYSLGVVGTDLAVRMGSHGFNS